MEVFRSGQAGHLVAWLAATQLYLDLGHVTTHTHSTMVLNALGMIIKRMNVMQEFSAQVWIFFPTETFP